MALNDDIAMFDDGPDDLPSTAAPRAPAKKSGASADDIAMFSAPVKDPRFVDDSPAETRPLKNTGPDLVGQVKDLKQQAADYVPPSETFIRNAGSQASFGSGPALEASLRAIMGAGSYDDNRRAILAREATGNEQNPNAATAGSVAGTAATLALPTGGALAEGASAGAHALQAAKIGGAYSAAGGAGTALSAGKSPAEIAQSALEEGAVGAATGGALGYGVGKMFRAAPERVDKRVMENIARGEAGGAAKASIADKMVQRAGEGGQDLLDTLERNGLKKAAATSAADAPAKVEKKIQGVISQITESRIHPAYKLIDSGPAVPRAVDVRYKLLDLEDKLRTAGHPEQAATVSRYNEFIGKQYKDDAPLTGTMLRGIRSEVGGTNTFAHPDDARTPIGIKAKQAIYGALNGVIEEAGAKTPGVNVEDLRAANKDVSLLLLAKDTLADRAVKAAKGGSSITRAIIKGGEGVGVASALAHAVASGDPKYLGLAVGEVVAHHGLAKAPALGRRIDYQAARLENAARQGSTPALLARTGAELGAARIAAPVVADRARSLMGGGYSAQDEADRELARRLQAQRAQVQP